jgi:uncharacterized protein (UPF0333 family)
MKFKNSFLLKKRELNKFFGKNKGQITMEFILTFSLVLMIFLIGIFIYYQRSESNILSEERWSAQKNASNIAKIINAVYLGGDGTTYSEYINWSVGDIEVEDNSVRVFVSGGEFFSSPIISDNVVWDISTQTGFFVCSKLNGGVVCENE